MNDVLIDKDASYRRGTIMGLTAAEAFMLICFALLLLLTLGLRAGDTGRDESGRDRDFVRPIASQPRFLEPGRPGVVTEVTERKDAAREVSESETMATRRAKGLELEARFGTLDLDLMEHRLRLMDNDRLRTLLESVQDLSEDELLKLTDLVSTEDLAKRLQDIEAYERIGLTPEEVMRLQSQGRRADDSRRKPELTGADVASQLRAKVGNRIKDLGCRILDDGHVICPESVSFNAGSATIQPAFDRVLQDFCRLWFEVLHGESRHIETVRIEGHASSEFGDLTQRQAFDANLDLSQRRASAVLRKCLDYGGHDRITEWARSRIAAVGYSSARPVVRNGAEDRQASRRVVFAIDMRSEE